MYQWKEVGARNITIYVVVAVVIAIGTAVAIAVVIAGTVSISMTVAMAVTIITSIIALVSLPHTPQGLSPIGSNRHCVVGRDPRAPANKNEIN